MTDTIASSTTEYLVVFRYLENNAMRRSEMPVLAYSFLKALSNAEKILLSNHPTALVVNAAVTHVSREKARAPRLVFEKKD